MDQQMGSDHCPIGLQIKLIAPEQQNHNKNAVMDEQEAVGQKVPKVKAKNQPKKKRKKMKKRKPRTPTSFDERMFDLGLCFRFPDSEYEEICKRMLRQRISEPYSP